MNLVFLIEVNCFVNDSVLETMSKIHIQVRVCTI